MIRYLVPITAAVAIAATPAPAQAVGPFDPSFGRAGKLSLGLGEGPALAAMAADPSGGFVLAGSANPAAGEYALVRVSAAGRVDASFGNWRPYQKPFFTPTNDYDPVALAPRPGSGWVTVGKDGRVVAHRSDGSLDTSFGTGGVATPDLGPRVAGGATAVARTSDKILVGGWVDRGGPGVSLYVLRMTNDGRLDPSWGMGGIVELRPPGTGSICPALRGAGIRTVEPSGDGTVLVAGTTGRAGGGGAVPVVARLGPDGSPYPTYGTAGYAVLSPPGGDTLLMGGRPRGEHGLILGLQAGRVCAPAEDQRPSDYHIAATHLGDGGQVDTGWAKRGFAAVRFPAPVELRAVAPAGRYGVALVGAFGTGPRTEIAVAELTGAGQLYKSFGGGRTCGEFANDDLVGGATAALQVPRGLLVGGATSSDTGTLELALYRRAFTPGGVECFNPEVPSGQPLRVVRLRAILGRRGRLSLKLRRGFATKGPVITVCLGTRARGDVVVSWDGRVKGRTLRPGLYTVNLESRDARGRLLGRSYRTRILLEHRASGPRRPHRC